MHCAVHAQGIRYTQSQIGPIVHQPQLGINCSTLSNQPVVVIPYWTCTLDRFALCSLHYGVLPVNKLSLAKYGVNRPRIRIQGAYASSTRRLAGYSMSSRDLLALSHAWVFRLYQIGFSQALHRCQRPASLHIPVCPSNTYILSSINVLESIDLPCTVYGVITEYLTPTVMRCYSGLTPLEHTVWPMNSSSHSGPTLAPSPFPNLAHSATKMFRKQHGDVNLPLLLLQLWVAPKTPNPQPCI